MATTFFATCYSPLFLRANKLLENSANLCVTERYFRWESNQWDETFFNYTY